MDLPKFTGVMTRCSGPWLLGAASPQTLDIVLRWQSWVSRAVLNMAIVSKPKESEVLN